MPYKSGRRKKEVDRGNQNVPHQAQDSTNDDISKKLEEIFEDKMKTLNFSSCNNCRKTELRFDKKSICPNCAKNKTKFTAENNMDPGIVPAELMNLSPLKELLIAQVRNLT